MTPHPSKERTMVIIKPDGVQRSLVGEIIKRFERTGLKIVALKLGVLEEKKCWEHYNKAEEWFERKGKVIVEDRTKAGVAIEKSALEYGQDIINQLVKFMTSGPVVAMVLQGNQAVSIVQKIVGTTEPMTSDIGTIRGDLTVDSYALAGVDERAVRNLIHCSDQPAEAEREIKIWFEEKEVVGYKLVQEQILYDVNLDGILE